MAGAGAAAGVEIGELEVGAALVANIGSLANQIKALEKKLEPPRRTRRLTASKNAAPSALTYTYITFPPPSSGRRWQAIRLSITGPDPFTTLTGVNVVAFLDSAAPTDSATLPAGFNNLLNGPSSVPNTSDFGTEQVEFQAPYQVVLCLKGLANNQQVNAMLVIRDVTPLPMA